MKIDNVIFCGKSKKRTGNTKFMLKALKRRVKKAAFINTPKIRRRYFWTDYTKIIQNKIAKENPDLVLIYSMDLPYSVLEKITSFSKTAIFYVDMQVPNEDKLIRYAQLVDHLFITNKAQIPQLKTKGIKDPIFCMQGCDDEAHTITPTKDRKWASDVAFIGRPIPEITDYRINLFNLLNKHYDLKVWGANWQDIGFTCLKEDIYPKEYAKICYASKIILGCDKNFEMECYFSNRTWITLGCGGFLLTNYVPGLETIFTKGVHLEWYHNLEECLDLIDYYLKNEIKRKKIALAGFEFVHSNRTYDIVMDEIISRIEKNHDSP